MVPEITPEEASMVKPAGSPEAVKVRASPGSISAALTVRLTTSPLILNCSEIEVMVGALLMGPPVSSLRSIISMPLMAGFSMT